MTVTRASGIRTAMTMTMLASCRCTQNADDVHVGESIRIFWSPMQEVDWGKEREIQDNSPKRKMRGSNVKATSKPELAVRATKR
jgi:hypothetical protein